MDNWLIFQYHVHPLSPMAGRGRCSQPRRWSTWANRVGRPIGKSVGHQASDGTGSAFSAKWPYPCLLEKRLGRMSRARTKTDTGGQVENTKAIGRTLEKELGKMAP